MDELLQQIATYGVIPILLIIVYKVFNMYTDEKQKVEEKNLEIREIEKENIKLLEYTLAMLRKINSKLGERN